MVPDTMTVIEQEKRDPEVPWSHDARLLLVTARRGVA